ncbi:MAG: nickel insertion protein [Lachnospiraceae bacterium]
MDIRSKDFFILFVQVDHLRGEHLGYIIDVFYENGASNVQILPSVTKKNRPSHVVIIDCKKEKIDQIEKTIVRELQTGGWHRIESTHRYLPNEILEYEIVIENAGQIEVFTVKAKHFIGGGIRPEHSSVIEMRSYIKEHFGVCIDYGTLYNFACAAIADTHSVVLDIDTL